MPLLSVAPDWSYTLGQAFLTAALSCGFECDRTWVSDGSYAEQPPPGCTCQLVVVVGEGWERPRNDCGARRLAEVRIVLDLCTVPPGGPSAIPDPTAINTKAQENASRRWQVMEGLRKGWAQGAFTAYGDQLGFGASALSEHVTPGPWRNTRSTGGMGRWEAVWTVVDDL